MPQRASPSRPFASAPNRAGPTRLFASVRRRPKPTSTQERPPRRAANETGKNDGASLDDAAAHRAALALDEHPGCHVAQNDTAAHRAALALVEEPSGCHVAQRNNLPGEGDAPKDCARATAVRSLQTPSRHIEPQVATCLDIAHRAIDTTLQERTPAMPSCPEQAVRPPASAEGDSMKLGCGGRAASDQPVVEHRGDSGLSGAATERGGMTLHVRRVSVVALRDMILEQVLVEKRLRNARRPQRQMKLQSPFD